MEIEKQTYKITFTVTYEIVEIPAVNTHTSYYGKIVRSNGSKLEKDQEYIGYIYLDIIHLQQIKETNFNIQDYFDANICNDLKQLFDQNYARLGEQFLALQTNKIIKQDILWLDKLYILPEFRGLHITRKIVDLLKFKFKSSCGLIIGLVNPFQSIKHHYNNVEEVKNNDFKNFCEDEETAFFKLMNYFASMSFKVATGINDKVIYINTDEIDLIKLNYDL